MEVKKLFMFTPMETVDNTVKKFSDEPIALDLVLKSLDMGFVVDTSRTTKETLVVERLNGQDLAENEEKRLMMLLQGMKLMWYYGWMEGKHRERTKK